MDSHANEKLKTLTPKTIHEVHQAYQKKMISSVELTRDFLLASKKDTRNIYLHLCEERALEQAKSADRILAQNGGVPLKETPLLGIPIAIKDALTIEGVPTTCGSKILENYVPPYTATAVKRLEEAGAIILGKTNMDEFAMGSSNENSAYGPVIHPTHLDRVPGGSSGGSAAAVKAGLCVASLGSDTGGSIRLPASFCGVVGLKPTYGRISRYGLIAFASSLDQIGPFAHTVDDAALLLEVMSGQDRMDSTSSARPATRADFSRKNEIDWKQIRIGMPQEYKSGGLSPAVEQSVEISLEWFKSQGAQIVPLSLPHTAYAVAVYYLVAVSEASSNLARFDGVRFGVRPPEAAVKNLVEFYERVRANFGPEVKRRIILGTFALSSGYSDAYYRRACQVRRLIKQDFDEAFKKVDFIVGPVSPTTAFKLGEKMSDPLQMYLMDLFTIPASLAGLPGISVPCGEDSLGLPVGLQLLAPQFHDEQLLLIARRFEQWIQNLKQ